MSLLKSLIFSFPSSVYQREYIHPESELNLVKRNSTPNFFRSNFNSNLSLQLGKRQSFITDNNHLNSPLDSKNYENSKINNFHFLKNTSQNRYLMNSQISNSNSFGKLHNQKTSQHTNHLGPSKESPLLRENLKNTQIHNPNSHLTYKRSNNPFTTTPNDQCMSNNTTHYMPFQSNIRDQNLFSPLNHINCYNDVNEKNHFNEMGNVHVMSNKYQSNPMAISSKNYVTNINKFVLKTQIEIPTKVQAAYLDPVYDNQKNKDSQHKNHLMGRKDVNPTGNKIDLSLAKQIRGLHLKGLSNSDFRIQVLKLLKLYD